MNLSESRIFKILPTSLTPIFGDDPKSGFVFEYILSKGVKPIDYFPYRFDEHIEENINYLFLVFVRSVIENYLYRFGYKNEQHTSDVLRFANQCFKESNRK